MKLTFYYANDTITLRKTDHKKIWRERLWSIKQRKEWKVCPFPVSVR